MRQLITVASTELERLASQTPSSAGVPYLSPPGPVFLPHATRRRSPRSTRPRLPPALAQQSHDDVVQRLKDYQAHLVAHVLSSPTLLVKQGVAVLEEMVSYADGPDLTQLHAPRAQALLCHAHTVLALIAALPRRRGGRVLAQAERRLSDLLAAFEALWQQQLTPREADELDDALTQMQGIIRAATRQ